MAGTKQNLVFGTDNREINLMQINIKFYYLCNTISKIA